MVIDKQIKRVPEQKFFDSGFSILDTLNKIIFCYKFLTKLIIFMYQNIFVAGTDTTTYTLEWAMAELIHNPEMMSKVEKELEQVVGKGVPVEETDVSKLPYLQAVIKETFRLHPPVPLLLPRKAEVVLRI